MKVLVTGGAGYIGSVCVERLLAAGHEVAVLDNLTEGHRSAVPAEAAFHQGCLSDRTFVSATLAAIRPDAVVHFAASALVGESMANPAKYFRNNVASGLNLLEAAVQSGARKFVFSSTAATYGVPDSVPISETAPTRPVNPYGESKLMFERLLAWFRQLHGMEYVVFRYFNAAGAGTRVGEHHRVETHLIPNVLRVALGQTTHCEVFGTDYPTPDGTCVRDYVHVVDIAEAHLLALQPGQEGTFNLGNGEGCSVREVIETCRQVTGRPIPVIEKPRRPGDPPRLVASAAKARRELGWQPRHASLEQIISSAWQWHLANPNGYPD